MAALDAASEVSNTSKGLGGAQMYVALKTNPRRKYSMRQSSQSRCASRSRCSFPALGRSNASAGGRIRRDRPGRLRHPRFRGRSSLAPAPVDAGEASRVQPPHEIRPNCPHLEGRGSPATMRMEVPEENMKVKEIMSHPVRTCSESDTLDRAARLMWEHNVGAIVVEADGRVRGLITDRDISLAGRFTGRPLWTIPVSEVMSVNVEVVRSHDSVDIAERLMRTRQIR